ncbi:N-hydroxyarylamine O-acetyltransferase [Cellvibrio zantedeschiae]|uniref:N-hydroxyarylamine O-acetyltransferase n=1 Tax=Cellvibrio zantedeschiae TaxID=1237077 RepID=A0ABQ3B439_9GAMM|nr:arylamine N-acetyltransferase [Cellvibrio zantedeschiae]GGY77537.1 N-hydroxyarylamine O-acetyltransferase [Cellvibrio zantedeschiae]
MIQADNFKFADYCKRIAFFGDARADLATLTALMRGQLFNVPFENLDVQAGKLVSIEPQNIVNKIVYHPRGGYCYEVNSLFAMALAELQIDYDLIGARPMFYPTRWPKTHMVVVAKLAGESYLCDVGFGSFGLRIPFPLSKINQIVQQDDDYFKLLCEDGKNYILQALVDGEWVSQFEFDLYPHDLLDFIPANYFNSKNPDTVFVQKLLVVKHNPRGRKILLGTRLKTIEQGITKLEDYALQDIPLLLKQEFGIIQ